MALTRVFLVTILLTIGLMLQVWLVSVIKRDVSIIDIVWGLGFVLITWGALGVGRGAGPRPLLVGALVTGWGVRLAGYLLWRNWGAPEDYRYRGLRARHGERFIWVSLYLVFGLQAALMWVVSLPLQVAVTAPRPETLTWLDGVGVACWCIGVTFEAIGDWQLARFKADSGNAGKVMNRGLWAYTRHPNYFGDAVVWWGYGLMACATPGGIWTVIGPALMTLLLLRISGVALLERKLVKTRPDYDDYKRKTNAFFPWFPRPLH